MLEKKTTGCCHCLNCQIYNNNLIIKHCGYITIDWSIMVVSWSWQLYVKTKHQQTNFVCMCVCMLVECNMKKRSCPAIIIIIIIHFNGFHRRVSLSPWSLFFFFLLRKKCIFYQNRKEPSSSSSLNAVNFEWIYECQSHWHVCVCLFVFLKREWKKNLFFQKFLCISDEWNKHKK